MASEAMDKALEQLDQAVTAVITAAAQAPEAASAATGGAIDPFVFQFAIFVLSISQSSVAATLKAWLQGRSPMSKV